jgi:hypothetical protein
MCHLVNRSTVAQCDCGYTFGEDAADVRGMLANQVATGWGHVIGGLLLVLLAFGSAALIGMFAIAPIIVTCGIVARGARMISRARISLRQIEARTKLPRARLVE